MFAVALGRARGIAVALAAVTVALAALSLLAQAGAKRVTQAMTEGDSTMEGGQEVVVGRRLAGVWAELRRGKRRGIALGVILGPSAAGFDIDPKQLRVAVGPQIAERWLTLSAKGANGADLEKLGELLIAAKLPVRLFVLAVTPTVLARSDKYLSDHLRFDPQGLFDELRAGHMSAAKLELAELFQVQLNRAFPERVRIGHHARVLAAGAKQRLFTAIGYGPEALYAPDPDPWLSAPINGEIRDGQPLNPVRDTAARELQEGAVFERPMGEVADKSWFDPSAYRVDSANAQALQKLIRSIRGRGVAVWIILLPEKSDFYTRVPKQARDCLREILKRAFGNDSPPVLDFGRCAADEDFNDSLHLTREGRDRFTTVLAEALRCRLEPPRISTPAVEQ